MCTCSSFTSSNPLLHNQLILKYTNQLRFLTILYTDFSSLQFPLQVLCLVGKSIVYHYIIRKFQLVLLQLPARK